MYKTIHLVDKDYCKKHYGINFINNLKLNIDKYINEKIQDNSNFIFFLNSLFNNYECDLYLFNLIYLGIDEIIEPQIFIVNNKYFTINKDLFIELLNEIMNDYNKKYNFKNLIIYNKNNKKNLNINIYELKII
jgi:hypothetical protein